MDEGKKRDSTTSSVLEEPLRQARSATTSISSSIPTLEPANEIEDIPGSPEMMELLNQFRNFGPRKSTSISSTDDVFNKDDLVLSKVLDPPDIMTAHQRSFSNIRGISHHDESLSLSDIENDGCQDLEEIELPIHLQEMVDKAMLELIKESGAQNES